MDKKMKKILVTGPTSAVGSNFIKFVETKYKIVTLGRRESDIIFDFTGNDIPVIPEGVDSIVHFAGMLSAKDDNEILSMFHLNVSGLLKICMAARQSGVKQVIYISSVSAAISKESEYYGYYSLTKKQAEEQAALYCRQYQISLCIIRPSQIFGKDHSYAKSQSLLYLMMQNAAKNKPVNIYGSYDAVRNYIYADNLFFIIDKAIEVCSADKIDVIDERNYKLSEIANIIIETFDSKSSVLFLNDKPDISDNGFFSKENYFVKWDIPFIDFEEGIEIMSAYFSDKYAEECQC